MSFKFYIDNQLTDSPVNDIELSSNIKPDALLGGLLVNQDGVNIVYNGNNDLQAGTISGYAYLKNLFDSGICNEASLTIYDENDTTELVFTGVIKIPQVVIDEQLVNLSCKIQDNSYYSYLHNNRELKVNFAANVTKSLDDFTPCRWYSIDMFNSNGCAYGSFIGAYYKGYKVTDALEFIIAAISDGRMAFRSDYLDSLDEQLFILKGQALLNPYTLFPSAPDPVYEISFAQLYKELNKIYNLTFFIDATDPDAPVFRIENYEYAYNSEVAYTFEDIQNLRTSVNELHLYSAVNVGSKVVIDGASSAYTWDAAISNYGWKQEQFFPLGQCNNNNELDLVNEFIIDNNAIQDTLILNSTAEIDSYFLVLCSNINDYTETADAHQFSYFGSPDCFYNLGINNFFKMQRHSVLFETTFGNFLGIGSNGFKALIGDSGLQDKIYATIPNPGPGITYVPPQGLTLDPVPYVNETTNGGYDGGNNYNNTTYIYTVPVTGDYSFLMRTVAEVAGMLGNTTGALDTWTITQNVVVYDSALNFKFASTQIFTLAGTGANGTHNLDVVMSGVLDATDIVYCTFRIQYAPNQSGNQQLPRYFAILNTSFFECNGTPDGGVSIASGNNGVRKYIHEFNYAVDATTWRLIKAGLIKTYNFTKDGITRSGHILDMKHNDWNGSTTIKLLTSNATTTE